MTFGQTDTTARAERTEAGKGPGPAASTVPARRRPRRDLMPLLSVGSIVIVLILWYLLTDVLGVIPPLYFPSVKSTVEAVGLLGTGLLADAGATAYRAIISWIIGSALGIMVGLIMARSRIVHYLVNPLVEALRPIPTIAMIPFTLLWFGLTDTGRLFLGSLVTFMILVVSTTGAARNVPPVYLRAAGSLGATSGQAYRTVVLPAIFPSLVSGLRVAAGLAWAVTVGAEFLGAQNGLGYLILQASSAVNTPVVLVGTVVVGLMAFIFEQILRVATSFATRWVDRA